MIEATKIREIALVSIEDDDDDLVGMIPCYGSPFGGLGRNV
jgi:hypothetical protein